MYMIEWSSVSREAFGSIFCGSLAPVPITAWVWWLVWMMTFSIRARSGICPRMRNARSISACDWYSALCSLVKLSRIARFGSPGAGSGT